MKIKDINGIEQNVDVRQRKYPLRHDASRSKIQQKVGQLLTELYPHEIILEEFSVSGNRRLKIDFFLPMRTMCVEVQGGQHHEHNAFFHGDRRFSTAFGKQQIRDRAKKEWAEINDFTLVEILETDSEEEIKDKLSN